MADKKLPLGICDNCGAPFPPGVSLYTRRGPRLYCSPECRNAGNSRAGAPIRAEKQRQRVASGEWRHPHEYMTPEQISETQSKAARRGRLREVAEGRWRNPALTPEAREKLSRPRKHGDNPVLHRAIEKLWQGVRLVDLPQDERDAYHQYQAQLRAARRDEVNSWYRDYYQRCMADPEKRAKIRARWRRQNQRRAQQKHR